MNPENIKQAQKTLSGLSDIDKLIGGMPNPGLIFLAARPAMGKTSLALNISCNISFRLNTPLAYISLAETKKQLLNKIISSESEVEIFQFNSDNLKKDESKEIEQAIDLIKSKNLTIDDESGINIDQLLEKIKKYKKNNNINFFVIDYVDLIRGIDLYPNEGNFAKHLKNLAMDLGITILCLSQLSRNVEERVGHKPILRDLMDESINRDSDLVMFLYRRSYYDPNDRPGQATVLVLKNRSGDCGEVILTFRQEILKFNDYRATGRVPIVDEFKNHATPY